MRWDCADCDRWPGYLCWAHHPAVKLLEHPLIERPAAQYGAARGHPHRQLDEGVRTAGPPLTGEGSSAGPARPGAVRTPWSRFRRPRR